MSEKIYREHHGLHPETGELQPGMQEHQGQGCQCKDCKAFVSGPKANARVPRPGGKSDTKPQAVPRKKAPVQPALPGTGEGQPS